MTQYEVGRKLAARMPVVAVSVTQPLNAARLAPQLQAFSEAFSSSGNVIKQEKSLLNSQRELKSPLSKFQQTKLTWFQGFPFVSQHCSAVPCNFNQLHLRIYQQ